jgi:hypothetical protein
VCLLGSTVLTLLECFLAFSSKLLLVPSLEYTILRVIDCVLGVNVCGVAPCYMTSLAFSFVSFRRFFSSLERST